MSYSFLLRIVSALVLSLFSAGCHGVGTQNVTVLSPTQDPLLESSSRIVLEVTCTNVMLLPDYTLRENLSLLEPMAKAWKCDVTFLVDRVLKGTPPAQSLPVRSLRYLDDAHGNRQLGTRLTPGGLTNGMQLRIGFDRYSSGRIHNLRIAPPAQAQARPAGSIHR